MTIKRSLILFWIFVIYFGIRDICPKIILGYLKKNHSGIRDIRGHLLWDIGYAPKQASEVTDLLLGVKSRRQISEIIELPSYVNYKTSWCHMISLV